MHTQESGKGMKKLRNNKIRKLLAFMVALALMVSCMPSAYTISASEAFGDGTEDIFTDGEITSEPAAEESTPDVSSADQEETEQAQQSTLTYENDSVKVTAEALEDGALPQNTALKADSVNENSSVSYDTVSQKLSAAATDKGSSLRGFFAYDVYFADGDGNRVEPNGRVRVTFEYKTLAAPELTDAASTSVTVEKLHYNSSTGDTDVNTLQANEDLKVLNVNEGKQIQTLQVETGNAAVFAVMWDSPETPAAENPEVTPDAEPSEAPAENPDAEPTEAPAEDPDVVEEPAEDIASPEEVPAADENGETSLIEVLGDDTNLRVSPSVEAEVLATVNAGTQLTLLDTVTAEDGATWYKVSWEGTEAYIRSDMAQVVDSSDEAEEPEDVQEEEIQPEITRYDYVIVQKGQENITVTVKYCDQNEKEIYAEDVKSLNVGDRLRLKELANWKVKRVVVAPTSGGSPTTYNSDDTDVEKSIELAESATVTAYYEPTTGTTTGDPTFFDYTVKVRTGNGDKGRTSINNPNNYEDQNSKKLTVGGSDINRGYSYNYDEYTKVWQDDQNQYPNSYTGFWGNGKRDGTVKGLLKKVDGTNVTFKYADPGFFKQEDLPVKDKDNNTVYLRRVYTDYKLNFSRTGDTYKLSTVHDGNGTLVANAGAYFFPLDSVGYQANNNVEDGMESTGHGDKNHNYFFGLRYDITFTLGDYIGDLKYKFTGDDDLWVVLDGNTVVIDLGGIHEAATGEVNLWDCLLEKDQKKANLTNDQKSKKHTLTVLYMERGAVASNCEMEFTLPNATISQVTKDPLGTLELQKVNNKGEGVDGALFTLYGDHGCENKIGDAVSTTVDGVKGKVIFNNKLRGGTYYLKETRAPDGYVRSTETWTVEVEKKSPTEVSVTLKDSSGKIVEDKKIVNQTRQEIIESSMVYNKTATVKKWDQRTYDINITASSKTTSSSVVTTGGIADVVMALDVSGSMAYEQTGRDREPGYIKRGIYKNVKNSLNPNKIYYYDLQWSVLSGYYSYPMINIDNKWMYYYNNRWKKIEDSDRTNIYEWPSRITALKEVVNQFIRNTATSSSESNIGLAPFNTGVTNATDKLLNVGKNKDDLIKKVSLLSADGGTSPHTALDEALKLLNNDNAKNPKYVILFTDGEPTGPSTKWDGYYQKEAERAAKALKDKGIKVFTVGFALGTNGQKFLAGDEKDSKNYPGIASEGCAFNATNAEDLAKIFETIQKTVTEDTAIENATITDVIDPRFVILDDGGNAITADKLKDEKTVQVNGGTVYLDTKGNQCIKWEGQTIPNEKENNPWSKSITVKAKDDYIGGNNVPTNVSPDSKISTGFGDAILPQPTVNVKADLTVDNLEKVIFLGDSTPTADLPDSMLSSILQKSKNYVYNETTKELEPVRVTKDDLTCSWAKDESFGTDELTNLESMAEDYPTEDPTRYYLKVIYDAGKPTETVGTKLGSTANTGGNIAGGETHIVTAINSDTKNYPDKEYGVYTIHIIKGQIQITKKLEDAAKKYGTFTFNVYNKEHKLIKTVDAKVSKNDKYAKFTVGNDESTTVIIAGLARGEYTVEEVSKDGYQLVSATSDSDVTNCKSEKGNDITFSIGTDNTTEHKDALEALKAEDLKKENDYYANYAGPGCVGKVDYTNKEIVADVDFVKVDLNDHDTKIQGAEFALYKAKVNDDSTWSQDGNAIATATSANGGEFRFTDLAPGNYLMVETKAASEYALPTNPWRITVAEEDGKVTVNKNDGSTGVESDNNNKYLIENTKLYSLPNSGGPGTYGFTISGVAILATALLLFINNKRREEEAKRS